MEKAIAVQAIAYLLAILLLAGAILGRNSTTLVIAAAAIALLAYSLPTIVIGLTGG